MTFEIGSIVKARGREWVVLPETAQEEQLLVVRPLGGADSEISGIYLPLEPVEAATFPDPDPEAELGNHLSCALLRDAVRLGLRSAAGPFRCLSRVAVEPRPYQLVPLLMALRQDPVRLLIADDVGVGKTVEALLIARELVDRGEIQRIAVLCPPHLAEQWQRALSEQFHIDATLVLASTAARLDRECGPGESPFDRHRHVVVSLDYIKSAHRFETFVNACPEFVIVDEAHTCTDAAGGRSAAQHRFRLLRSLVDAGAINPGQAARNVARHLVLVTATPHSGKPENFRSLLSLLDPDLANLPEDLSGEQNRRQRERLAKYLVQRRRGDVRAYMAANPGQETPFPDRDTSDATYALHPDYAAFFKKVIRFCRERVLDETLQAQRQRVRWWSALALLRCLGSSPASAAATLRSRAATDASETEADTDDLGRRTVLDLDDESAEGSDVVYGAQEPDQEDEGEVRSLRRLAAEAEKLGGASDNKLQRGMALVEQMVGEGYSPIVFCRFIPTVGYVAEHLRKRLGDRVIVEAITGDLPPEEREARVERLGTHKSRVLVCTDCLSEGVNLQHRFDAVFHYDLSWNPTRHEQREGRVDRFGQLKPVVRTVTFYGADNPVDVLVRTKLIEKHKAILKTTGVSVPVPQESDGLVEALVREVFFGRSEPEDPNQLGWAFPTTPKFQEMELTWERAAEREKVSRALFAQHSIKVEEVATEVAASQRILGGEADLERFTLTALKTTGAAITPLGAAFDLDLSSCPPPVKEAVPDEKVRVTFRPGGAAGAVTLGRTSPLPSALATFVSETALDARMVGPGRRCGVARTRSVTKRCTLLLVRARYHIVTTRPGAPEQSLLAEDVLLAGFEGSPEEAIWLDEAALERLLAAEPGANMEPSLARVQLRSVLSRLELLKPQVEDRVRARGRELLEAHQRVRKAATLRTRTLRVDPHLPADVLGLFVFLPVGGAA